MWRIIKNKYTENDIEVSVEAKKLIAVTSSEAQVEWQNMDY